MLCHQKEHILLSQYLAEFNASTEVVTAAKINTGQHPVAVKLVGAEQGFEVDILAAEESIENREEVEKEASQRFMDALFFYGISNAEFNALKTDIANQTL